MVSDEELTESLREFLRGADLEITTTAIVRRKLEEDFGIDLSDRKHFIRDQVNLFLQSQVEKPPEEEDEEDGEEVEEEVKKPKKSHRVKSEALSDSGGVESEEESESEEVEEEEESSSGGKKRKKGVKNKEVKKRGVGFAKVCSLSPELQNVVGVSELARTEVVKQIWAYIRERDLQDPSNRKNIRCDEALRALFRVDVIEMFEMNKALSKHIWPLGSDHAPEVSATSTPKEKKQTPKEKKRKKGKHEDSDELQTKEKRPRGVGSGFLAPLPLSEALVKFIGTGETILPRATVVKKVWTYIKENNLQDPSDRKTVICDDKLKELFDVESFVGFTVPKLLSGHFIKAQQ